MWILSLLKSCFAFVHETPVVDPHFSSVFISYYITGRVLIWQLGELVTMELLAATLTHGKLRLTLLGPFWALSYKDSCIDSGNSVQHKGVVLPVYQFLDTNFFHNLLILSVKALLISMSKHFWSTESAYVSHLMRYSIPPWVNLSVILVIHHDVIQ